MYLSMQMSDWEGSVCICLPTACAERTLQPSSSLLTKENPKHKKEALSVTNDAKYLSVLFEGLIIKKWNNLFFVTDVNQRRCQSSLRHFLLIICSLLLFIPLLLAQKIQIIPLYNSLKTSQFLRAFCLSSTFYHDEVCLHKSDAFWHPLFSVSITSFRST